MRLVLALAALTAATPAAAERITAYWKLEPTPESATGARSVGYDSPFFTQRILPVRLVRLTATAQPAGDGAAVPAGTLLFLVVNATGKSGWCTVKDWSGKNQAKSLFIPALDKRPCFSDRDGDGAFDASFSVFDAYTLLSPPQPRGSIDAALPMAAPAGYQPADVRDFPWAMTLSYQLLRGKTAAKTRLRATLDRPGHSEYTDVRNAGVGQEVKLVALATDVIVKSAGETSAEVEVVQLPDAYVAAEDNGTVLIPALPQHPAFVPR